MDKTVDEPAPETAQRAADKAVDQDALLDGEDPHSKHAEDVEHWIAAYSELIGFKDALLAQGQAGIEQMDNPNSRKEAGDVDMTLLRSELARYQRRLEFWKRRQEELQSARG